MYKVQTMLLLSNSRLFITISPISSTVSSVFSPILILILIYIQLVSCPPCKFSFLFVFESLSLVIKVFPCYEGTSLYAPSNLPYHIHCWALPKQSCKFGLNSCLVNSLCLLSRVQLSRPDNSSMFIDLYILVVYRWYLFWLVSVCDQIQLLNILYAISETIIALLKVPKSICFFLHI